MFQCTPAFQVFTNDKFLMGVGSTGLKTLTSIAEHLILDPSFVCPSGGDVVHLHRWFRIITFALTSNVRDARCISKFYNYIQVI